MKPPYKYTKTSILLDPHKNSTKKKKKKTYLAVLYGYLLKRGTS